VTAIAKTLDVARSNLIERLGRKRPEQAMYRKTDDPEFLPLIKKLVDARPILRLSPNHGTPAPEIQSGRSAKSKS
jgi:hypothetical protein